ncbi:MAG: DUF2975 domain-containing protein [Pseudomonadota bacterium]
MVIAYGWLWIDIERTAEIVKADILPRGTEGVLTPSTAFAGFVTGLVPLAVTLFGLWAAGSLFHQLAQGETFTGRIGTGLRRLGLSLALVVPAVILSRTIGVLLLTMNNIPGERHLVLSVEAHHLVLLVAGMMIWVIGWVAAEAAALADEHSQIV